MTPGEAKAAVATVIEPLGNRAIKKNIRYYVESNNKTIP